MSLFVSISSISKVNNTTCNKMNVSSSASSTNQFSDNKVTVGLVSGLLYGLAGATQKAGL